MRCWSLALLSSLLACSEPAPAPDGALPAADAGAADTNPTADAEPMSEAGLAADGAAPDASAADGATPDADPVDSGVLIDLDQDGLDDGLEARLAEEYLPFRSLDPDDGCPLSAILFRLRPHPEAPGRRLHLTLISLFERDCGASGHVGDDEVVGLSIDPSLPAPEGMLAMRAISHQSTPCERVTDCGPCPGGQAMACTLGPRRGRMYPVVFYSRGKHGAYLDEGTCDGACFVTNFCTLAPAAAEVPMFNAGEPAHPLIRDLTAAGVVTSTAGWVEQSLFGYDPWGPSDFGGAGSVASDLDDPAFLTPACAP